MGSSIKSLITFKFELLRDISGNAENGGRIVFKDKYNKIKSLYLGYGYYIVLSIPLTE